MPFATIVTKDYPDDRESRLDRPGAFRLNVAAGTDEFRRRIGALALAADGRSVLLVETEGRQGIAQLFDTPPLPYEERRVAVARGGGEVKALAIDVEEALLDYLDMFYNLGFAGRAMKRIGAIDFVTTVAPGLRDVLLTGKIKERIIHTDKAGNRVYDAVVVDAPPTGRITRFLNVTNEMGQLARSGPIKTQSDGVMAVLRSPQTAVHLVTILEDMPVQETADAIDELRKVGLPLGSVIVNLATDPVLPADDLARAVDPGLTGADLAPALAAAHLPADDAVAEALAAQTVEHARRWSAQDALRDDVEALELGSAEGANERTIRKYIHADGIRSNQLVLGITTLAPGSVWNTMPAHVHDRRMEAYLYHGMEPQARVLHLMGEPQETRHLFVANEQAVISPPWSVHSGAGIGGYTFIWAMAGDNVDYTDMDFIQPGDLR